MNLDIVEDVFKNIDKHRDEDCEPVLLLRSTVIPGTTRKLKEKFPARCPSTDMTDREIWLYSGQVKLVNILESVYIEQNNLQD